MICEEIKTTEQKTMADLYWCDWEKNTFEICLEIVKGMSPEELEELGLDYPPVPMCTVVGDTYDVPTVKYYKNYQ